MLMTGQNYDYEEEREFGDQNGNFEESRGFAEYEDMNKEEVRAFEDEFADSFQKAFAENARSFEDENVS